MIRKMESSIEFSEDGKKGLNLMDKTTEKKESNSNKIAKTCPNIAIHLILIRFPRSIVFIKF